MRFDLLQIEDAEKPLGFDIDAIVFSFAKAAHDGVRRVPVKSLPVEVERQQVHLITVPPPALEHVDRRHDDGMSASAAYLFHEFGEIPNWNDVVTEVEHLAKPRKLLGPLPVEIGSGGDDDDSAARLRATHCRCNAERFIGLAHTDFVGKDDAGACVEYVEGAEHGVLLPLDVPRRDPVLVGACAQVKEAVKPGACSCAHAFASP